MARKRKKKRTTRSNETVSENVTEVSALDVSFTSGEISGSINAVPEKKFSEDENTSLSGSVIGITSGEITIDPKSPLMVSFNTTAKIEISGDDVIDESKPALTPPASIKAKIGSEDATPVPQHLRAESSPTPAVIGDAILKEIENSKKQDIAPKKRHAKKSENSGVSGIIIDDAPPEQRMKSGEIVISTDKCFDPEAEQPKKDTVKTTTPMAVITEEADIHPDESVKIQLRTDEEKRRRLKESLKQLINSHPSPFILSEHPIPDKADVVASSNNWSSGEGQSEIPSVPDKIEIEVTTGSIILDSDPPPPPPPPPPPELQISAETPKVKSVSVVSSTSDSGNLESDKPEDHRQSEETENEMPVSTRAEKRNRKNRKNRQHQAVADVKPATVEVSRASVEPAAQPAKKSDQPSTFTPSAASEITSKTEDIVSGTAAKIDSTPLPGTVTISSEEEQSVQATTSQTDTAAKAATPLEQRLVSSSFASASPIKNTHDLPTKDFSKIEEDFFDADLAGDSDFSGLEEIISQIETENPKKSGFFDSLKKIFISGNTKTDPPKPRTPTPSGTATNSGRRRRK